MSGYQNSVLVKFLFNRVKPQIEIFNEPNLFVICLNVLILICSRAIKMWQTNLSVLVLLISPLMALPTSDHLELIILHNNDMHARFEQTDAMSTNCNADDAAANRCYGGFARIAYK